MKGPELLKHYEDNWVTDMGAWFPGERVVLRGKDVFTELNNHTWMEYLVYAVTGKESSKTARLIEGLWSISTSYPEPRLWNNRVAALAGTTRSSGVLAIAAAVAVSEARVYGLQPIKGASDFLHRTKKQLDAGETLEDVIEQEFKVGFLFGYGRPLVQLDERVEPLLAFAKSIGAGNGCYTKLAFDIEDYLITYHPKYRINIAAVAAGLAADEGITPTQFYHLTTLCFTAGLFPCYIDAERKPGGTFFPLSTSKINYIGTKVNKPWQRAEIGDTFDE